jgi:hypothetical protein
VFLQGKIYKVKKDYKKDRKKWCFNKILVHLKKITPNEDMLSNENEHFNLENDHNFQNNFDLTIHKFQYTHPK